MNFVKNILSNTIKRVNKVKGDIFCTMNLEKAIDRATDFIEDAGYDEYRLVSIRKKGKEWHVKLDVGIISTDIRYVIIDDENEEIIGYEEEE